MYRSPLDLSKPLVVRKGGVSVTLPGKDGQAETRELKVGEILPWREAGLTERTVRLLWDGWYLDVADSATAPPVLTATPASVGPAKRPARAGA